MADHNLIVALPRLCPSCLGKEHRARTESTQFIHSVYVLGKNSVAQERNYLKKFVRTFLNPLCMPPQV